MRTMKVSARTAWYLALGGLLVFFAGMAPPEAGKSSSPSTEKTEKAKQEKTKTAPQSAAKTNPTVRPADVRTKKGTLETHPVIEPALWGYCPVSYFTRGFPVRGDKKYAVMYHDKLYYLCSEEAKERFEADPKKYLPQFGGYCTTALGGMYNNWIPGDPLVFDIRDGKLYLFSSERAKRAFEQRPEWYIGRARVAYAEPALQGYCPVSYQQRVKAMPGREDISYTYKDRLYYFANKVSRAEFIRDPDRYVPQYDGYCAAAMMDGRRVPSDPRYFFVSNQKTYLFHDEPSMVRFTMHATENIRKADAQWKKLNAPKRKSKTPKP